MLSLKIDCVLRLHRALLGINVQHAENGKLIPQPLAMKALFERQHLRWQVKNMLKAVRLLGEADDENESSSSDEEADAGDHAFQACGSLSVLDNSDDAELPGADEGFLLGIRCAAHTLQLAASDALRESRACTIIAECCTLVKRAHGSDKEARAKEARHRLPHKVDVDV